MLIALCAKLFLSLDKLAQEYTNYLYIILISRATLLQTMFLLCKYSKATQKCSELSHDEQGEQLEQSDTPSVLTTLVFKFVYCFLTQRFG